MMQEDEVIYEAVEETPVIEESSPEVVDVEIFEAFQAPTAGDEFNHALLTNREIHDAHPITAITGLREELDSIEALQTIYSDKKGNADYYEWADGHALGENGVGYFVTLNRDIRTISICAGDDIFGVVVPDAAFVGGQDEVARDAHYGLVATSGVVHVMCELDVVEGDYVVANEHGKATKSTSGRGYKVVAQHDINGVPHALINLNISADQVDLMGAELQGLGSRMNAAESNIVSAVNVANQAYQKASEMIVVSTDASNKAQDALDTSNKVLESVGSLENAASQSQIISAQAKAIAEGAMVSAEAMCNKAIEDANKALVETEKLREDIANISGGVSEDVKEAIEDMKELTEDLEPLATWKDDDGNVKGVAGFVARADDDSATLASIVQWKGDAGESLAGFVQEATEENATIKALASYEQKDENGNVIDEGVSGLISQVDANKASIEAVAKLEGDGYTGLAGLVAQVDANKSELSNIATHTYTDVNGVTKTGLAAIDLQVTEQGSTINNLTDWQDDTNKAMARIEQKADANGVYIQSTVANMDKYAVGPYSQAYGFTLEQAASVLEEGMIYVPTTSHTEEYKYDDNKQTYTRTFTPQYLYKWGKIGSRYGWITVDKNYSETTETNTSAKAVYFTTNKPTVSDNFGYWYADGENVAEGYEPHTLYRWDLYTYEDGDNEENEQPQTDYHWVAVATLKGNSQSRAVSQIRQDANSIEFDVTNVKGDLAGIKVWAGDDFAAIQDTVSWHDKNGESLVTFMQEAGDNFASASQVAKIVDKNGNIQAASIVTAVNDAGSTVMIDADHIKFEGFVSFANTSDVEAVKESAIYDTKVEYALSSSLSSFVKVTEWSTVAPAHQSGKYMWQRTTITKGDGTIVYSDPTCIHGADGVSISSTTVTYGVSTSASIKPTEWQAAIPAVAKGSYLWTCTVTDYTNGTDTVAYTYALQGEDGKTPVKGVDYDDGTSVTVSSIQYQAGTSATTTPTGTWSNSVVSVNEGQYLWSKTTFSDGNVIYGVAKQGSSGSTPYIKDGYWWIESTNTGVKAEGKDGDTPTVVISDDGYWVINGTKTTVKAIGVDAPKVVSEKKQFYLSTSDTSCTGGSWSDSPSGFTKGKYMWSRSVYTMSDNTTIEGTGVLDKTYTTISSWCSANNETLIDGANIATGTVTADKMTVLDADSNIIFQASATDKNVQIGDFHVGSDGSKSYIYTGKTAYNDSNAGVYLGTDGIGLGSNKFSVTKDGYLQAYSGVVGRWMIGQTGLWTGGSSTGYTGISGVRADGFTLPSLVTSGGTSYPRFYARAGNDYGSEGFGGAEKPTFVVLDDGSLYASAANIEGTLRTGTTETFTRIQDGEVQNASMSWDTMSNNGIGYSVAKFTTGKLEFLRTNTTFSTPGTDKVTFSWLPETAQATTGGDSYWCLFDMYAQRGRLSGYWQGTSGSSITSWRGAKYDIEDLSDKYSVMFDNLRPVRHKYIDGTSGRYHTGFILDELKTAMDIAGVGTDELGAYCVDNEETGSGGIRYSELVALNVYEIQKLKARIAELEAKVTD